MNLIRNAFKVLSIATLFSANVFAADILVETFVQDSNTDAQGGWKYDINSMDVQWATDGQVTVDIETHFVDYNNTYNPSNSNRNIVFGDLLISTNGENTPFNYAFKLNNRTLSDSSGYLTQISSTKTSNAYHGYNAGVVNGGQVLAGRKFGDRTNGSWSTARQNAGQSLSNFDTISFSFNVNGIGAFQNASQIAFSWAMTCANDVVTSVVNLNQPSTIPEPTTILLMLIGLGFLVNRSKKSTNNFQA
jgi:hypothetical protein